MLQFDDRSCISLDEQRIANLQSIVITVVHSTSYDTTTIDTLHCIMNTVMTIYCFVIYNCFPFSNITPNSFR